MRGDRGTRLLPVTCLVLLASVVACSDTMTPVGFGNEVTINVTKDGSGSGTVTSPVINSRSIDCGPTCSIVFDDATGSGSLSLTATPASGSVHAGWTGSTCSPTADCSVSANNGTIALDFDSNEDVTFSINATFDLLPPIVFESYRDGNAQIYVINPDGSGLANLSNNATDERDPAWSPDQLQIAFVSDRDGTDEIYVMDADGMNQVRRTDLPGSDRRPAYSPDGAKIAFDNDGDGDDEVWVMDADGSSPTQLTFNTVNFDQGPTWSMNSAQILFTTFRTGSDDLFIMDADGMNQTLLLDTGDHDWQPDWSPDGTRIVFTVQGVASGVDNIWIVNADGSTGLQQLTSGAAEDREATWSPDGNWIAFTSDRNGNRDIFIMTPDGGNVTQITTNVAEDSRPSWVH